LDELFERFRGYARRAAFRFVLKRVLIFLAPYLVPAVAVILMVFLLLLLVAAVYEVMAPMRLLTGVLPEAGDEKLLQQYQKLCDEYNVKETWLVSGESWGGKPFYPGKGISHIGELVAR